jgi:hypothetical protein
MPILTAFSQTDWAFLRGIFGVLWIGFGKYYTLTIQWFLRKIGILPLVSSLFFRSIGAIPLRKRILDIPILIAFSQTDWAFLRGIIAIPLIGIEKY